MTASVLSFAFCESVAVFGLALFLMSGEPSDFYLFLLISLIFFAVSFPQYGGWEEWTRARGEERKREGSPVVAGIMKTASETRKNRISTDKVNSPDLRK
jgi:hypothetical protein